jgi:hypothetical protein
MLSFLLLSFSIYFPSLLLLLVTNTSLLPLLFFFSSSAGHSHGHGHKEENKHGEAAADDTPAWKKQAMAMEVDETAPIFGATAWSVEGSGDATVMK